MSRGGPAMPVVQGWCPGALRPMRSGDGLVVRVRPRRARLDQEQLVGIARLARQHGNGMIDLTARANLQLRGVSDASHAALIAGLARLGLVDATAQIEQRRNIVVTPFWQAGDDTAQLADALADALALADAPALPAKFGFAVDAGVQPRLRGVSADIRIERGADGRLLCRADGADAGARVRLESAVPTALALARWFVETGGSAGGRGRMSRHVARGTRLPEGFDAAPAQVSRIAAPAPGVVPAGVLVGLEFGQIEARTLGRLARWGALRVTPWRMLLIEGATAAPDVPGLIVTADDPMLRVIACTGSPGCLQALQPTRALARALAPHVPAGALLHVSGCAKGCAHPGPAALTLTAHRGGFDLIRGGRTGDAPASGGHAPELLAAHPHTLFEGA